MAVATRRQSRPSPMITPSAITIQQMWWIQATGDSRAASRPVMATPASSCPCRRTATAAANPATATSSARPSHRASGGASGE